MLAGQNFEHSLREKEFGARQFSPLTPGALRRPLYTRGKQPCLSEGEGGREPNIRYGLRPTWATPIEDLGGKLNPVVRLARRSIPLAKPSTSPTRITSSRDLVMAV